MHSRSFFRITTFLSLLAGVPLLPAQTLLVDVNGNGDASAAGWTGWDPANPNNSALDTGVGNFAATFATGGTVDVRITTSGNTFERNYGVGAVTGTFSAATPAELWQDQYFHNQAGGGPLTITLDNLQAGPYSFTIYNYYNNLNTAGHAGGGTAITDIFVNGVDSGIDATAYGGNDTAYAAAFLEANVSTVGFTVANDNDTVTLEYRNPTANHFGLNGFALAAAAPDNKPPSLSSTAPLNNALDVPAFSNLVAGFDEAIVLGASGDITIRNLTDATDVVISLAGPDPDGTLAVTGAQSNQLTIDPAVDLDPGDDYAIQIAAGAIEDTSMNPFGGILDDMTWSFTTAPPDLTAPMSNGMGPVAGATDVPVNSGLMLTFDEAVQAGGGNITIHLADDDSVVATIDVSDGLAVMINGPEVTIVTGNLDFETAYYVNIPAGAFTDLSGNPYAGINDTSTWTFATAANPLQDADLMVDFSRGDEGGIEPLQPGWQGFALLETGGTLETETFPSPAAGNDGTVTVSIQGNSHSRDYAPATGTFEPLSALLRDGPLMNAAGTAVLTMEGLRAGLFEITTLHHTTQFGPSERTGTPFDVTLDDANGTGQSISQGVLMSDNASASLSLLTFQFLSDGTNPVSISFTKLAGDDHFAFPGFLLSVASPPEPIPFDITNNGANLDLEWESQEGFIYNLRTSTDLEADLATWDLVEVDGGVDILGTPPLNMHTILRPGDPVRFYRVQEFPPPPLLEENFDGVAGPGLPAGWTTTGGPTPWEVGDPLGGFGPGTAFSGLNCVGTSLLGNYDPSTDSSLVSPAFFAPAGGATLSFRQVIDTDLGGVDAGTIRILDDADALIEEMNPPGNIEGVIGDWTAQSITLPASAHGMNIKIEFRFVSDASTEFAGFYLDDVLVEAN